MVTNKIHRPTKEFLSSVIRKRNEAITQRGCRDLYSLTDTGATNALI